jgi:hypothetical protein
MNESAGVVEQLAAQPQVLARELGRQRFVREDFVIALMASVSMSFTPDVETTEIFARLPPWRMSNSMTAMPLLSVVVLRPRGA